MYEVFEHTADLGLRIRAADLPTLLAEAGAALFSAIVTNFDTVRPAEPVEFQLEIEPPDDLLHDWLAELLYAFYTRRLLFCRFEVQVDAERLTATAWGEPINAARHQLDMEIKAITYHALRAEREPGGDWLGEVIVDI
jgi:SHS2 domain-containing protein